VNHFEVKAGALHCEGVPLEQIARDVGTPTYVYSTATLTRHLRVVQEAFAAVPTLVCYSVKANSNLAVLKLFSKGGAGFDIVSAGELERVRCAGGDTRKVVFAGVGKTEAEMVAALKAGLLMFNVESAEELEALARVGQQLGVEAPFALRVNPDVDAKTHKYIATGLKTSKFGVPFDEALSLYARSKKLKGLVARGLDCHIGSQLTDTRPVRQAMTRVGDAGMRGGVPTRCSRSRQSKPEHPGLRPGRKPW
jgi:diaminopimelate decarboxylase